MSQNKYHTLSDKKQLHHKKVRSIQLNNLFKQKRSLIDSESSMYKMDLQPDTRQIIHYNYNNQNQQHNYGNHQVFFQNRQQIAYFNENSNHSNNNYWINAAQFFKMNNNFNQYGMNQYYNYNQPFQDYQHYQQVNHKHQFKNILSNQKILQNYHKISPQKMYKREIQSNNQNFNDEIGLNSYQLQHKIRQNQQKNKKLNVQQKPQIIVNNRHQIRIKSPLKNRQQSEKKLFNQASFKFREIYNKNKNDYVQKESIYKRKGNVKIFHKILGKGTYGNVYQGYHQRLKFKVAVKEIQKKDLKTTKSQIQCLQKLNNQYIVRLYETFEDGNFIYLVFELATDNLREYLKKLNHSNIHKDAIKQKHLNIAKMLILGMNYLHENGVIHRDLKFENVLISGQKIKICDFGLARTLSNKLNNFR